MTGWVSGWVLALALSTLAGTDLCQAQTLRLTFVGDVMLDGGPGRAVQIGQDPMASVAHLWANDDTTVANLESVVSTLGQPADKPYTFRAHPRVLPLVSKHFDVVSLANNHSGDFGREAFADMVHRLGQNGQAFVGGGLDRQQAHQPRLIDKNGLRLALLAYNDIYPRSFEANDREAGVAWANPQRMRWDIEAARRDHRADLVLVFMHWGVEYQFEPSARQQELGRWLIDQGVDAVVGTHAHTIQDTEVYRGKPIIYGLGNLVLDGFKKPETQRSWVLSMVLNREGALNWRATTVRANRQGIPSLDRRVKDVCWRVGTERAGDCR